MWTRAEVKKRAWNGLKNYYWYGVLSCFLLGLLGILSIFPYLLAVALFAVCICIAPLAPFMSCIVDGVYADILEIGGIHFFMQSIKEEKPAPVSTIFSGFKTNYGKTAKILIFRNVFLTLWTMLFIIPGIIKSYEYRMIPYLIADYPEKDQDEIFRMSKEMMTGNKGKAFVFDLSFLGWCLLAAIPAGLGYLFLAPYYSAACAELYLAIKEERLGVARTTNHVVYQPENQNILPQNAFYDNDDEPTRDINSVDIPSVAISRQPVLVGIQGEYAGASIPLEDGQKLIVGRDATRCNVILSSPQVSRLHMTVEYVGGKFIVVDYSTYGTFDLDQGQLPKEKSVTVATGTCLRLGNGDDIFKLDVN